VTGTKIHPPYLTLKVMISKRASTAVERIVCGRLDPQSSDLSLSHLKSEELTDVPAMADEVCFEHIS
jgi:hypothetical protein